MTTYTVYMRLSIRHFWEAQGGTTACGITQEQAQTRSLAMAHHILALARKHGQDTAQTIVVTEEESCHNPTTKYRTLPGTPITVPDPAQFPASWRI